MRLLFTLPWCAVLLSCVPAHEPAPTAVIPPISPTPAPSDTITKKALPPTSSPSAPRATNSVSAGIRFVGVAFDSRLQRLIAVDQQAGPGSQFQDAASAGRAHHGLAAVNAGFFTPEGAPLGLVIASGNRSGSWNSASSLGGGVWHEDASGQSGISRRETLGRSRAASMNELIQAGPMLIDHGHAVSGLDPIKSSVRTILLWDGGSRWWIGQTQACTLAELSAALSHAQPANWPIAMALNLDGGRSSDLWISENIAGGPVLNRAPWNRPVRNFLVLTNR